MYVYLIIMHSLQIYFDIFVIQAHNTKMPLDFIQQLMMEATV